MLNTREIIPVSPIPAETPLGLANGIVIEDLSLMPRIGVKGKGLQSFIGQAGLSCGDAVNKAYRQEDGALVLTLAPSEILWLGTGADVTPDWFPGDAETFHPDHYFVPRADSNYWFKISGKAVEDGLARLCSLDFRPNKFADLRVAQTIFAKTNAIIVKDCSNETIAFHILGDQSLANYVWDCLAMTMAKV